MSRINVLGVLRVWSITRLPVWKLKFRCNIEWTTKSHFHMNCVHIPVYLHHENKLELVCFASVNLPLPSPPPFCRSLIVIDLCNVTICEVLFEYHSIVSIYLSRKWEIEKESGRANGTGCGSDSCQRKPFTGNSTACSEYIFAFEFSSIEIFPIKSSTRSEALDRKISK